jgi:hypothetical protein
MFDDIRMPAENSNADKSDLGLNVRLANLDQEILLADNRPNQRNINGMHVTRPLEGTARGDKVALQQGVNPFTGQSYLTPEGIEQYQKAALLEQITGLPLLPQYQTNPFYQPNPFQPYPYQPNGPGNLGQNLLLNMFNQGHYYQNPAGPNWGQPPVNFPRDPMTGQFLNPNDPRYYDPNYNPNYRPNTFNPNPPNPNLYNPYNPNEGNNGYRPNPDNPNNGNGNVRPNPNNGGCDSGGGGCNGGGGRWGGGGLGGLGGGGLGGLLRIGLFAGLLSMIGGGGGFGGGGFGGLLGFGLLSSLFSGGGGFGGGLLGGGLFGPLSNFRRR